MLKDLLDCVNRQLMPALGRCFSAMLVCVTLLSAHGSAIAANDATFVSQNIPAAMTAGETYTISVVMKNTGTTSWTVAGKYFLTNLNSAGWSLNTISVGTTIGLNGQRTFSATVTAPSTPGTYAMQWQMEQQGVGAFGAASAYVPINVAARVDDAQFVSQSTATTIASGAKLTWSVALKNTGNTTWKAGKQVLAIQPAGSTKWALTSMPVTADTAPGAQRSFSGSITGPAELNYHDLQWRMQQVGGDYFGEPSEVRTLAVMGPAPTLNLQSPTSGQVFIENAGVATVPMKLTATPAGLATVKQIQLLYYYAHPTDPQFREITSVAGPVFDQTVETSVTNQTLYFRATDSFNKTSQITFTVKAIEDNASVVSHVVATKMVPRVSYSLAVTMKNTGGTTWDPQNVELVSTGGGVGKWGVDVIPLTTTVAPNGTAVFNATLTAPDTEGSFYSSWRLREKTRSPFGATASVAVTVARSLPTVTMSLPTANQAFDVPTEGTAQVPVSGSAAPGQEATISKIEILDGAAVLATVNGSTVNQTVELRPGAHSIKLRTTDNWGEIGVSPAVTVNVRANDAVYVTQSIPTTMQVGKSYNVSVTMRNSGQKPWVPASGYALGAQNPENSSVWQQRVLPTATVNAAQQLAFSFPVTAPAEPGTYNFQWRMLQEGQEWFGDVTPNVQVVVKPLAPTVGALLAPLATDKFIATGGKATVPLKGVATAGEGASIAKLEVLDGTLVIATATEGSIDTTVALAAGSHILKLRATDNFGQVVTSTVTTTITVLSNAASYSTRTVPSTMEGGKTYQVSVSMRNAGTATWTAEDGYQLVPYLGNTAWTTAKVPVTGSVATNGIAVFTFDVVAPGDPGSYDFLWRMEREGFEVFGAITPALKVTVTGAPPIATLTGPVSGSTYIAGADGYGTVHVQGSGTPIGSATILKVEVFSGPTLVGIALGGVIDKDISLTPGEHTLQLKATDSRGAVSLSNTLAVTVLGNGAAFVSQSAPPAMIGGDTYPVSVTMQNSGSTTWQPSIIKLVPYGAANDVGWHPQGSLPLPASVAPGAQVTFNFNVVAPAVAGNAAFQWRMHDEERGDFGAVSTHMWIAVSGKPTPSAQLAASPTNVRVQPGQSASIRLTGAGNEPTGDVNKLEVFVDNGSGYPQVPVKVVTGTGVSIPLVETLSLPNGSYRIKLRVTDSRNRIAESQPVQVNVTDSVLLGAVKGVRSTGDLKTQLVGWACRDASQEALTYEVFVNSPPTLGGMVIATGAANVDGEGDDGAKQLACRTPGVSHHFVADLTAVRAQYPGAPLYVLAKASNGDRIVLPCEDNSCTMPDAMRIGMTTPNENDLDRFRLPSPVFLRAQVSSNTGAVDEVAFNVDGTWVNGVAEGAGAYSVSHSGLAASNTPYAVYARVRQGGTTLISEERMFYVDPAMAPSPLSPRSGTVVGLNVPTVLSTQINDELPSGQTVKFFIDGPVEQASSLKRATAATPAQEIGNAVLDGTTWRYSWTPRLEGTYQIVANVLDGAGSVLMQTPSSTVTVSISMNPSSPTPTPVQVEFTAPTASADAGTLPGDLSVSVDGAATYSVPLAVPPGTAGMEPNLSLNYSSNGSNGMLGLGWSLGGISAIHRCAKTIATDGVPGRINFDDSDRLCLDGQRLLVANVAPAGNDQASLDAAYWTPSATMESATKFRTELESHVVVTRLPWGAFRVEKKDGRTYYYGTSVNSVMVAQGRSDGKQLLWPHARTEDHSGNFMDFDYAYDGNTGEYVPQQIRYGGNTHAGQGADLAVRFSYEARDDAQIQYIGGSRNDMRQRLTHVSTYIGTLEDGTGGTLVRDYGVAYVYSEGSGRSLVSSIKICADTAQTNCLPATTFNWGTGSVAYKQRPSIAVPDIDDRPYNPWDLHPLVYTGDTDGSGGISFVIAEQVYTNCPDTCQSQADYDRALSGRIRVRLPSGAIVDRRLDMPFGGGIDARTLLVGDLDGDGRDDLVLVNEASPTTVTGYCLNSANTDGSINFNCDYWYDGEGVRPTLVDVNHDHRQHVMFGPGRDCFYQGGKMTCSMRSVVAPGVPLNAPFLNPTALDLSKQGRSDFYSVWKDVQPQRAYDPDSQGVSVCWSGQSIECRNIYSAVRGATQLPRLTGVDSVGDLNGDGLTDFAYQISGDTTPTNNGLFLCLSKENDVDCARIRDSSTFQTKIAIGDFLGDGLTRLLIMQSYTSGNSSELCRYVNGQLNCQTITQPDLWEPELFGDINGNGALAITHGAVIGGATSHFYTLMGDAAQDKMTGAVNGLGLRQEVDYARSDDGAVYSRFATIDDTEQRPNYPMVASPAGVMVKQHRVSNGQSDWISTSYRYEGMTAEALRPGTGGFALMRVYDEHYGLTNESVLAQAYPYTGMVKRSRQYSAACTLNHVSNVLNVVDTALTSGAVSAFPYVQSSTAQRKDLDCSDMGKLSTVNEYTDGWGNLNVQTTTAFVDASKVYTTKTATTFKTSHVTFSGQPTRVEVSKTNPDGASVTRTVAYTYNDGNGLRETETIEPDLPALKLTTTYDRSGNKFGLVNKQTQSWTNPACADANWPETGCVTAGTRVLSDIKYDGKGRYPETVSNAVGLSELRSYDAGTGVQLTRTDVNGLITTWALDSFGRVKSESPPDGTQTRVMWKQCAGDCPDNAATLRVTETYHGEQRFSVPQVEFADSAGHLVRHHTWGFDGKAIVSDAAYDSRGRLQTSYHPRHDPAPTYTARVLGYDALSRITEVVTYDEGNNAVTATTAYKGLERAIANGKVTNGKAQTRTESRNVLGQLIQVTDANDGVTKFGYEPFGNLNKTTDPGDHVIEVDYDTLGRKVELRDPDLGKIQYAFNPLGQVWRQINPKQRTDGKASYFGYDMLDRKTARYEPDLNSFWIYDTATTGKGQLAEAYTLKADLKKDYRRVHSYDPKGRPLQTTLYLTDSDYTSTNEYDGWGRLIAQKYKRGKDVEKRIDRRYNGTGYLSSIERGAMKLWQVSEQDAANRPTSVVLGNGLVQKRTYNEYSARLTNAQLVGNDTPVMQEGYSYDLLGNVTQRTQYWGASGVSEAFDYDNLNRLHTSTINGDVRTFTYTADGNMLTKTGVGSGAYLYTQAGSTLRPHAVKSITGMAGTFEYDDNGNLTSGNGRVTIWNSFDMPLRITKGTHWSSFTYGPEHQRTRQDRSGNAWTVYAGGQEVESVDGQVTVKTYWPNGIGVEIDRPNGTTELNWTHLDRLGSVVAISRTDGSLGEPLAYDAWGKRRMLTSQSTPDSLDGVVDNKGYTGHEMLDRLDLVHMNGRVYDPLLARFLSGDPLVQDPVNGQSYSRYAYVFNNPTNYTDPSGFEGAVVQTVVISRPRESADMWMVNNWAQRFLSDAQTHAERMRTAMSGAQRAVSRIPVRAVVKVTGRFVLVNGGRVVGGAVGGAISAGCDIITAGGCAPLNPLIVTTTILIGAAAGDRGATILAESLDANSESPAGTNKEEGAKTGDQTNPYKGPVDQPVVVVDQHGNAIPVKPGEQVKGSPDGDYQQVLGPDGKPTGDRLDRGGHKNQRDPRAQGPHGHRPGVTTPDGNPHLPIYH